MAQFPLYLMLGVILSPILYVLWSWSSYGTLFLYFVLAPLMFVVLAVLSYAGFIFGTSLFFDVSNKVPFNVDDHIEYKDAALKKDYGNRRIPIETLYEAYFVGKVDFKGDLLEHLYDRQAYANFNMTQTHIKFLYTKLIPEGFSHSMQQDKEQVTEHYDRGNDFYRAFLGPMMVYTSGIFHGTAEETLEEAQTNKLEVICRKLQLREGEHVLDLGCGWGTLVRYMANKYKADATGCTLAKEQTKWANDLIKTEGIENNARILCMDYRDVPFKKYHKITCVEMSEHVGVWKYNAFLNQVSSMLQDDGIFYLQIAGLRRAWQFEDLLWGVFMGTYVFPGADASCPLSWNVWQLEGAGFEVSSVDNIGIHYSATLKRWYDNWKSNEVPMSQKYGVPMYRKWLWFLAWAVIASEQGSATCWQIVAHKNTCAWDRKRLIEHRNEIWAL